MTTETNDKLVKALKAATMTLRKEKSPIAASAQMVVAKVTEFAKERDVHNPVPNDDDAVKAIKKSLKTAEEALSTVKKDSEQFTKTQMEIDFLKGLLPAQVSEADLSVAIAQHLQTVDDPKKAIGIIMKKLTEQFGNTLDRATASKLIQVALGK